MKLRFTIRDLLWLVVVAAVFVAWWVDHYARVQQAQLNAQFWQDQFNALQEQHR